MYAVQWYDYIPRGGFVGTWFQQFMPYLGSQYDRQVGDYRQIQIFRCPSWPVRGLGFLDVPNSEQTICYVVSSWTFEDAHDETGYEVFEPTKISSYRRPQSTIYIADNESAPWWPIIIDENDQGI